MGYFNCEECDKCKIWDGRRTTCLEECMKPLNALDEYKEYKRLEEQGLLLRLPVAIGSTLYQNRKGNIVELKTIGIIYDILSKEWLYEVAVQRGLDWIKTVCSMECIGEIVFLTKEEAEQALKQMGE